MSKKKNEPDLEEKASQGVDVNEKSIPGSDQAGLGSSDQAGLDSSDQTGIGSSDQESLGGSDQTGLGSSDQEGLGSSDQSGLGEKFTPKIAIVIPYLKRKAQGKELLFAVRSIAKNFAEENYQLVVIGDKEEWFSDEILFIDKPCISDNPQADVIDKIKSILLNEDISDEFAWSNDDIYFVAPVTIDDLKTLRVDGILRDVPGSSNLYNRNRVRTIEALRKLGRPIRNFATHTPVVYEKEKMLQVFETFKKEMKQGLLLSSAYFNLHFDEKVKASACNWEKDKWSLRVVSNLARPDQKETFRKLIKMKKWLNHSESGYSKLLMDWLQRQFPDKCKFER